MLQCNRRIQLLIVEFPQDYIDVLDFAKVTPETKQLDLQEPRSSNITGWRGSKKKKQNGQQLGNARTHRKTQT